MKTLTLHATNTPSNNSLRYVDLLRQHRDLGYIGVGANFVIYRDGDVDACRREPSCLPSPCPTENTSVLLVGGLSEAGKPNFTVQQLVALNALLQFWEAIHPGSPVVSASSSLNEYEKRIDSAEARTLH